MMAMDYSLYLVTDSTNAILGDRDLIKVVEAAIQGGVTIVQYRDKCRETKDLIRIGTQLHDVCRSHGVPFLVNDRVDVALAIGAEGVHVGQDDIDLKTARKLLGSDAVIGVTCSNPEEARVAAAAGATYLGIGTMFATTTKENTKAIIGTAGTREILQEVSSVDPKISTVAIGGINASNVQQVINESKAPSKKLDGVAIISAIIAARDPKAAAEELRSLIQNTSPTVIRNISKDNGLEELLQKVPLVVKAVGSVKPVAHNMTNLVVQNFAANAALCIGASPIMSNNGDEAEDLANLEAGSLVINMGTVTPEGLANYIKALRAYSNRGRPVLLDPVGAGATKIRREAVKTLMSQGCFDIIKGNEAEIQTILGETMLQQKGVDSGKSELTDKDRARIVKRLAARERNVIVMTGEVDFVSDGNRCFSIHNGHPFLGSITGSGCTLGTVIASCLAVENADKLLAALSGILMFTLAAEHANDEELAKTLIAKEEDLALACAKEKKEKEIRSYRHKLQRAFVSPRDTVPPEDEIKAMSSYLGKLEEHPDLEESIIRSTKIHEVLKHIIQQTLIPGDKEFQFKQRSHELLQKWNKNLQIPISSYPIASTPQASSPTGSEPVASSPIKSGSAGSDVATFSPTVFPNTRSTVKGPGTFVPAFLDALYGIAQRAQRNDFLWLRPAQIFSEEVESD